MNLLVILNSKPDSKEILMTACDSLQAEDPQSFYGELWGKIRISECRIIICMHTVHFVLYFYYLDEEKIAEKTSRNSISQETEVRLETFHETSRIKRKIKEDHVFNSFFRLSEGELTVSIVAANQVALPFESELVSALWLVRVQGLPWGYHTVSS